MVSESALLLLTEVRCESHSLRSCVFYRSCAVLRVAPQPGAPRRCADPRRGVRNDSCRSAHRARPAV